MQNWTFILRENPVSGALSNALKSSTTFTYIRVLVSVFFPIYPKTLVWTERLEQTYIGLLECEDTDLDLSLSKETEFDKEYEKTVFEETECEETEFGLTEC